MHHSATNKYPKWNVSSKCFNCLPDAQQSLVDPNKDDVPETQELALSHWVPCGSSTKRHVSGAGVLQQKVCTAVQMPLHQDTPARNATTAWRNCIFSSECGAAFFCGYCSRKSYERLCLNSHFKVEELILRWKNSVREIWLVFAAKIDWYVLSAEEDQAP